LNLGVVEMEEEEPPLPLGVIAMLRGREEGRAERKVERN
jgi:hypothetical protein